mmetsp:Transcript_105295/g.302829  ORF Transcript_105295/g.302829 Transcript_105295/m.302829 type:complete len:114 (+) Transcript_105295:2-343(+)
MAGAAGADGIIRVWGPVGAAEGVVGGGIGGIGWGLVSVLEGHRGPVAAIAWDPSSSRLLSGGADQTARIWDVPCPPPPPPPPPKLPWPAPQPPLPPMLTAGASAGSWRVTSSS